MKVYENDCLCCDYCTYCGADKTPHYYCDECKDEFYKNELYIFHGKEICVNCLLENFTSVEEREG